MDNTIKYTKLQELAATIHTKLELLNSGKLSTVELEEMTEQSRELFERLVVLRYKAYDESVNGKTIPAERMVTPTSTETNSPTQEEVKWESNQVSLIDAIEEVTKTEKTEEPQPMFTFGATPKHDDAQISNMLFDLAALPATESVNEMLAKTMGSRETLAQSLEHKPIADLKEAITLNQRFQFSRELFKGNNQDYELAIDHLNRVSRDEALNHLSALRSKYEWNNEAAVTHDFIVLVERRHQ
jgi:hypothetical protein